MVHLDVEDFFEELLRCFLCHKEPARRIQSPGAWERKKPLEGRFGCDELVLYGIRDTVATPRKSPRHRDGAHWNIQKHFEHENIFFQFIDKKYQAGQRYIYQITKTHKDSFTKVEIILTDFNFMSDI